MTRPPKDAAVKLSRTLPAVRCTAQEQKTIHDKAKQVGLSVSAYIRQMVLQGKIHMKQNQTDLEAVQQLRKLGINLNQQTKKLNATGVLPVELKQLWQKLETTLDKMMEHE